MTDSPKKFKEVRSSLFKKTEEDTIKCLEILKTILEKGGIHNSILSVERDGTVINVKPGSILKKIKENTMSFKQLHKAARKEISTVDSRDFKGMSALFFLNDTGLELVRSLDSKYNFGKLSQGKHNFETVLSQGVTSRIVLMKMIFYHIRVSKLRAPKEGPTAAKMNEFIRTSFPQRKGGKSNFGTFVVVPTNDPLWVTVEAIDKMAPKDSKVPRRTQKLYQVFRDGSKQLMIFDQSIVQTILSRLKDEPTDADKVVVEKELNDYAQSSSRSLNLDRTVISVLLEAENTVKFPENLTRETWLSAALKAL